MKIGDLVTLRPRPAKHGLIECAEVGIIQKVVPTKRPLPPQDSSIPPKNVYHVLWLDGGISNHYSREITILSKV
jgi:hypothetical protein|tara:strand:- start:48 stop:269 length:222 start_codon:yes stop_codon:yes gene_type:complete